MSLFPAYSGNTNEKVDEEVTEVSKNTKKDLEWLENSSYQSIAACLHSLLDDNDFSSSSSDEEQNKEVVLVESKSDVNSQNKSVSKSKGLRDADKKKERNSSGKGYKNHVDDLYFEDKKRNKMFCTLTTLESSMRPKYDSLDYGLGLGSRKRMKRKAFHRYHEAKKHKNTESIAAHDVNEELKQKTEHYEKALAKNPNNIDMWFEYIDFQVNKTDRLSSLYKEREHFKRAKAQKMLAIVEKGLVSNSDSVELLQAKLNLMSEIYSDVELADQIQAIIKKDSRNIVLWQALITSVQTSNPYFTVTKVLDLYKKLFPILKQKSKFDSKSFDKQVFEVLYKCLVFLRQVGLWEKMWEIIRVNFCLNLSLPEDTLQNINAIDETTLMNLEEVILTSKLPLYQLWLRIESLRESCHWIGVDIKRVEVDLIGDENRIVSTQDIGDFIYPTISRDSNFALGLLSIFSLKVPLLPSRHCTLKDFQLEDYHWELDTWEYLLPMLYPSIWSSDFDNSLSEKAVIVDLLEGKLTSGPQFLQFHPAQESYLDFIRSVFSTIGEKFTATHRTSIFVWWLKFERLLVFMDKNDPSREEKRNKKLKSVLKSFLKKSENRNNLHFYREFAMIEYELGSVDSSIQVLKTIIQAQDCPSDLEETTALFSLYRTIFEVTLKNESISNLEMLRDIIVNLRKFSASCFKYNDKTSVEEILHNELLKFLMDCVTDESEDAFFLPNMYCDMLLCYCYLIYLSDNELDQINDLLDLFDKCLAHCSNCNRLKERFFETEITFLQFCLCKSKNLTNSLISTVTEATKEYPNNFFFLSLNALNESKQPYWKLKTKVEKLNVWSIFSNCLAGRARITYLSKMGLEEASSAMINKMLSFHKAISNAKKLQNCPLVWRFYMLLIKEHKLCEKKGEEVYFEAIDQCPWARSVYISAAEIAPQTLQVIQKLIKEKELRMHVTPEELDILREE